MIDTIFYFAKTDDEYQAKLSSGEISDKTIAFVEDTNKIYINGHDYIDRQTLEGWQADVVARLRNITDQISQDNDLLATSLSQQLRAAVDDLNASITEARQTASSTSAELTQFKSTIGQETQSAIETAVHNAVTNSNGVNVWTEVNKANEGVSSVTTRLNKSTDSLGNIRYTSALQSVINTGIDNNEAIADIAQRYAVLDENQEVLEWLSSGFKSRTGEDTSFAAMYAAGESATQDAIAQAKTEVLSDVNNNYVATANLASQVTNIVSDNLNTSLADIALKSDITDATATIQANYTSQQNQITNLGSQLSNAVNSIAQVRAQANENRARAELLTALNDNGAAVINESAFDRAMSTIIANSGQAASAITTIASEQAGIAETNITTQMENALTAYATSSALGQAETRILNYITDSNGDPIRSADISAQVDQNSSQIAAITRDVEGARAAMITESKLDRALASLLSENEHSSALSQISAIADNQIAAAGISTQIQNATAALATKAELESASNDLKAYITDPSTNEIIYSSQLKQSVDNTLASLEATTRSLDNTVSGLVSKSGLDSAIAQLFAENNNSNTKAAVEAVANDKVSSLNLDSRLQGAVTTARSGMVTTNTLNDAIATLGAYLEDRNGNKITSASIKAQADTNAANISALATSVDGLTSAGFVTLANLDTAVAGLFATAGDATASIQAIVDSGINGQDFSQLELNADQIKLSGHTLADHIEATSGTIGDFIIDSTKLSATNNGNTINVSPSTISTYLGQTATNLINTDGTGMLAKGGISWDANGHLTLSQAFLESLFNALANGALLNNTYKGIDETFTIYHSLYNNSASGYYNNATDLYNEISLWNNSTAPQSAYLGRTTDRRNTAAQSYPFSGTVQQKREYYFRYKDIIGTFTSGILTSKRYVDPATQIPVDEFPELRIDHSIYIIHIPTISEFAQANNLVANKFVGVVNRPVLKFTSAQTASSLTSIFNISGGDTVTGFYDIVASSQGDISNLANPTEGTWAIAWQSYYSVDGGASGNGWSNEPYVFLGVSSPIASTDYSIRGFILKYTNNAWTILLSQTALQTTCVQYRANETE